MQPHGDTPGGRPRVRAWEAFRPFLAVALWAGLVVGLVEVGLFAARAEWTQHGLWRKSPHVVWMIPAANVALFGLAGLALGIFVRPLPRIGSALASWGLGTLALATPLLAIPGLRAVACLVLAGGLATWVVPAIDARRAGFRKFVRWSTPVLVPALLTLAGTTIGRSWWGPRGVEATATAPEGSPNVLLIVLDTVRADATSLNGSERDTTPRLADFARRGARFDRAIATSSWTLPSHASLFTGRWPWELTVGPDRALDNRFPTLAEHFGRHGYATGGFAANTVFCTEEYGLARGFGHYEDYVQTPLEALRGSSLGWLIARRLVPLADRLCTAFGREASHPLEWIAHRKTAAEINQATLRWIANQDDRPFFAFLNYIDAHDPYLVPGDAARPYVGRPFSVAERRALRDWIDESLRDRSPEEIRLARDAYDDCLAYLDGQIGRLLDELERLGRLENTVVVITSDHGEQFGEHARDGKPLAGHRLTVYQPEVHVPLVIVAPGRVAPGTSISGAAGLRNVPATIVALTGVGENSPFPGTSLLPDEATGESGPDIALAEFSPDESIPVALRYQGGAAALMRSLVAQGKAYHRHGDGREELYDLESDPLETRNLADDAEHGSALAELRDRLDALTPRNADHDAVFGATGSDTPDEIVGAGPGGGEVGRAIRIDDVTKLGIGWEVRFRPPAEESVLCQVLERQELRVVNVRSESDPDQGEVAFAVCRQPGGELLKGRLVEVLSGHSSIEVAEHLLD